jgi:nucleoside-diphosphate-sugar epimerase
MKVAVTGASGNVGTAVLRTLIAAGHDVVGLARRPPPTRSEYAVVEWRSVDLTHSPSGVLASAFTGADAVIHLAWGFQPTHDEAYLESVAIGGTKAVLAAAAATGVQHVVHMSSLGAYSPGTGYADETHPTGGIATSTYSRHKAAAERLLDAFAAQNPQTVVTRMRPSIIGQRSMASGLLRYVMPAAVPASAVRLAKVLPVDRTLQLQLVHADDVADAYLRVVEGRVPGAFNIATRPALTPADIAGVLGARHVHVPYSVMRAAVAASWRLHLQPVDAGWLDMAFQLPLLDPSRAQVQLGWQPRHDGLAVLRELVDGIREGAYDDTPILRRRSISGGVLNALTGRSASHRQRS